MVLSVWIPAIFYPFPLQWIVVVPTKPMHHHRQYFDGILLIVYGWKEINKKNTLVFNSYGFEAHFDWISCSQVWTILKVHWQQQTTDYHSITEKITHRWFRTHTHFSAQTKLKPFSWYSPKAIMLKHQQQWIICCVILYAAAAFFPVLFIVRLHYFRSCQAKKRCNFFSYL